MKKTLFIITIMILVISVVGQSINRQIVKTPRNLYVTAVKDGPIFSERQSHHVPYAKGSGLWMIGNTNHDRISNASARNTASILPNGDATAIWTYLEGSARGTGYNSYSNETSSWEPFSGVRLENLPAGQNPGYPSHAYTTSGEIVVSHNPQQNTMMVLTRDKYGEGDWQQNELSASGIPGDFFGWPAIATNGNVVHMIAAFDFSTNLNSPLYFRSPDAGKTWDIIAYKFPEMPQGDREGQFADDYTVVVKGNHVVFAYCNLQGDVGGGNIGYMESMDGGTTWTHKPVYECNFNPTDPLATPRLRGRTVAAAIDDTHVVHIAFSTELVDNKYAYPFEGGIHYWKDTQDMLTINSFDIEYTLSGDDYTFTKLGYQEFPNFIFVPELLGFKEFYFWEGADPSWVDGNNDMGTVCAPRIVAEDGIVYLTYSSIIEQPMIFEGGSTFFFRGVFLTVSDDNGDTFDQYERTSWLSYHPYFFQCDWSAYNGPVVEPPIGSELPVFDEDIYGRIVIINSSENCWPTMASHSGDGNLLIQWTNTYKAGPLTDPYDILALVIPKDMAGVFNNTRQVYTGKWDGFDYSNYGIHDITGGIKDMKIFPNPAQNVATLCVNSLCNNPCSITVTNIMGQVVLSQKEQLEYGEKNIQLNISNFASGVYLVNIKTDNATRTHKLIVK